MGIDKDDGDNIRNDTRAPFAWEGLDRIGRDSEYGTAFPGLAVKRLSHLRSYLLTATRGCRGSFPRGGGWRACELYTGEVSGRRPLRSFSSSPLSPRCRRSGRAPRLRGPIL